MRGLVIAMVAAGCFAPSPPTGAPCGVGGVCPRGLTCSAASGTCELHDIDAPRATDAAVADTPPDARATDAAPATWSIVQLAHASAMSSLTIAPTGPGHLIVIALQSDSSTTVGSVTDDARNTYTSLPSAHAIDAARGTGVEVWYAADSTAGATTISVTPTSVAGFGVWEVSGIRTTAPVDDEGVLDTQAATTTPAGPQLATSAPGDFIVSVAIVQNAVTGVANGSGFTNDFTIRENGWAHLTDNAAPAGTYQAIWQQNPSGTYCATAAAFFAGP